MRCSQLNDGQSAGESHPNKSYYILLMHRPIHGVSIGIVISMQVCSVHSWMTASLPASLIPTSPITYY